MDNNSNLKWLIDNITYRFTLTIVDINNFENYDSIKFIGCTNSTEYDPTHDIVKQNFSNTNINIWAEKKNYNLQQLYFSHFKKSIKLPIILDVKKGGSFKFILSDITMPNNAEIYIFDGSSTDGSNIGWNFTLGGNESKQFTIYNSESGPNTDWYIRVIIREEN